MIKQQAKYYDSCQQYKGDHVLQQIIKAINKQQDKGQNIVIPDNNAKEITLFIKSWGHKEETR